MVKNGQKLKKGSFFFIKTLTLEISPNGMIRETQKKTEISDVVAAIVKNRHFFYVFFENSENSQAKNSVGEKKKSQKCIFLKNLLEISQNRIFHWEWANRREKMKAPYRIFISLMFGKKMS